MEVKTIGHRQSNIDEQSQIAIYHGLNMSQMAKLFEMDRRDLIEKLERHSIKPSGKNGGHPIYKLKDVMPVIVKPLYDIEEYLKKMHHNDLPKHLTKEFWAGLRSRQEYELKAGNLWPTERVVSEVGELFKLVKMSALLTCDTVERQVELSEEQRKIINDIMHGMLRDLNKTIIEKFSTKEPSNVEDEEPQDVSDDW